MLISGKEHENCDGREYVWQVLYGPVTAGRVSQTSNNSFRGQQIGITESTGKFPLQKPPTAIEILKYQQIVA
jgi:hypothetical protein